MRIALLVLLCSLSASATELYSGVSRVVTIPGLDEPTLFDFTVTAPAGARWLVVEATTGDEEHDVDLYARFGQRPALTVGGDVVADHRSETPAGVDEHIFINTGGTPPLQTGVYHVALYATTLGEAFEVKIKATVQLGGVQQSFLVSTFDSQADGWTLSFPESGPPGSSVGDPSANLATPPEGSLRVADFEGGKRDYAIAPPKFLGDLEQFADPRFELDFRYLSGPLPLFPIELRLLGGDSVFRWTGPLPEPGEWMRIEVPLEATEWEQVSGSGSFAETLRNVARIEVSMEHTVGPEVNEIDNFSFRGEPPPPTTGGPGMPGVSTFEQGMDGWRRNFPASAVPFSTVGTENAAVQVGVGGFESDGFLLMIDGDGRDQDWAVAPPKFTQGLAGMDRPWYEFHYRRFDGAFPFHGVRLRLVGGGSIYEWSGARSRESWQRLHVPVDEDYWILYSGPDDWSNMLRNVQRLEVSMDNAQGAEVNGIDNFHLRTQYTPPVGRALHVDRTAVEAQAIEGAESPEPVTVAVTATGDELKWTVAVRPTQATWLSLSKAEGRTPDAFALAFDPEGLPRGLYEAEVMVATDEFGVAARKVAVTFVVGPDPRVPLVYPEGVVHAAEPLAALSPGGLGSLYGEFLASAETAVGIDPETGLLPTEAGGIELVFHDGAGERIAAAPLLYVSAGQVNFQIPYEVAGRGTVFAVVRRDGEESASVPVTVFDAGPGIFVLPNGLPAVVNPNGSLNGPDNPAAGGEYLTVYFTGAGAVAPALETGRPAPLSPLHIPEGGFAATLAGAEARILGAALSPTFVGLAQVSLEVKPGLGAGRRSLRITVGGRGSNTVQVWLAD